MKIRPRLAACFPLLVVVACSSSNSPAPVGALPPGGASDAGTATTAPPAGAATVKAATLAKSSRAVTGPLADSVEVRKDALVADAASHPDLANATPGTVLIGERGTSAATKNPEGFLRRVVSVTREGANVLVKTEPTTLLEAFDKLDFHATLATPALTEKGIASLAAPSVATGGLRTQDFTEGPKVQVIDASGTKVVDETIEVEIAPGKKVGIHARASLPRATVAFTPSWDVGMQMGEIGFDLQKLVSEAHVIGKGKLDAELEVTAGFDLVGDAKGADLEKLIAKAVFKKTSKKIADYEVSLGSIPLGPLSAPASAHFTTELSCTLDFGGPLAITASGKASGELEAGFRYAPEGITPVFSHDATAEGSAPTFDVGAAAHVQCTLEPRFALKLFGVASADVWADPYVSLGAEAFCNPASDPGPTLDVAGYAQAGVSASTKVGVNVFGFFKKEIECKLGGVDTDRQEGTASIPTPQGSTCTDVTLPERPERKPNPLKSCFGDEAENPGTDGDGGTNPGEDLDGGACHDTCEAGDAMRISCTNDGQNGACIKAICEHDAYCCTTLWGPSCVGHVTEGDYGCAPRTCP